MWENSVDFVEELSYNTLWENIKLINLRAVRKSLYFVIFIKKVGDKVEHMV